MKFQQTIPIFQINLYQKVNSTMEILKINNMLNKFPLGLEGELYQVNSLEVILGYAEDTTYYYDFTLRFQGVAAIQLPIMWRLYNCQTIIEEITGTIEEKEFLKNFDLMHVASRCYKICSDQSPTFGKTSIYVCANSVSLDENIVKKL